MTPDKKGMNSRFLVVSLLLLLVASYLYFHRDMAMAMNRPFSTFPAQFGTWRMSGESFMTETVLDKLRPTDYLSRNYVNQDGKRVTLYIGYHGGGEQSGEIHSPKHCLPGSGWHEIYSGKSRIEVEGKPLNMAKSVYQKDDSKELFLYWFQVKGKTLDNEYALKIAEIVNSLLYKRRDAAFIRISVPFAGDENEAVRLGEAFAKDVCPVIKEYLPG